MRSRAGLAVREESLRSGVLSYIMCPPLQVMMQDIIMHGMRRRRLKTGPRGAAGVDNGDARPSRTNAHGNFT